MPFLGAGGNTKDEAHIQKQVPLRAVKTLKRKKVGQSVLFQNNTHL